MPLVRRFKKACMKAGPLVKEFEIASLQDAEILSMFLGRDGDKMRAPVLASGDTIFAGTDEATFRTMLRK